MPRLYRNTDKTYTILYISIVKVFFSRLLLNRFIFILLDNVQNISTILETVRAAANTQVQLKCITSYSNFLEAEMFWTFQDEKLNDTDSRYKTETYKLNSSEFTREEQMSLWITNISDPDFGCYSCALNSSMGLSSATIVLAQMKSEKGR